MNISFSEKVKIKLPLNFIAQTKREWKMNTLRLIPEYHQNEKLITTSIHIEDITMEARWDIWKDCI